MQFLAYATRLTNNFYANQGCESQEWGSLHKPEPGEGTPLADVSRPHRATLCGSCEEPPLRVAAERPGMFHTCGRSSLRCPPPPAESAVPAPWPPRARSFSRTSFSLVPEPRLFGTSGSGRRAPLAAAASAGSADAGLALALAQF